MIRVAQIDGEAEVFYSLQGEGTRAGEPAVFLRLAGCNRRCSWCDTKYSWETGLELTEEEVARRMLAFDCRHFVITGGEPLLQTEKLENLCLLLPENSIIEVETNGTLAPSPILAQRVNQWNVSPKLRHSENNASLRPEILSSFVSLPEAWFKFVVRGEEDWAEIESLGLPRKRLLLMPCAADRESYRRALPEVCEMCLRHGVRLSPRLHVELWDQRRGC